MGQDFCVENPVVRLQVWRDFRQFRALSFYIYFLLLPPRKSGLCFFFVVIVVWVFDKKDLRNENEGSIRVTWLSLSCHRYKKGKPSSLCESFEVVLDSEENDEVNEWVSESRIADIIPDLSPFSSDYLYSVMFLMKSRDWLTRKTCL